MEVYYECEICGGSFKSGRHREGVLMCRQCIELRRHLKGLLKEINREEVKKEITELVKGL